MCIKVTNIMNTLHQKGSSALSAFFTIAFLMGAYFFYAYSQMPANTQDINTAVALAKSSPEATRILTESLKAESAPTKSELSTARTAIEAQLVREQVTSITGTPAAPKIATESDKQVDTFIRYAGYMAFTMLLLVIIVSFTKSFAANRDGRN